ncbi:diaminopimelate decarboxylase [Streptantibioticus rubrisoli]|uniref:Diaminopimelate decarboxylase n=1 Tax=Streptantibioticus rubrisoli TaxID=1387313 RepID=A0ABT1P578_9ACTN|nr:diaminopimelate decarboxylase [Streptantibioticus rubrisoli]MCQ4040522.1 diaminopimelate decarboxylase [Streptantibioticus rubrisoli]
MPISQAFAKRLDAVLGSAAQCFGTPFHIYDEQGIHETCTDFDEAFADTPYREYFAVKGLPNPTMLRILAGRGMGFDCSSRPELALAAGAGAVGHDICFTSNNTSADELRAALKLGALINVDDVAVFDKLVDIGEMPDTLCFRVQPGKAATDAGASYLGDAESAKFGVPVTRLVEVCARAQRLGVTSFGLHMMLGSGFMSTEPFLRTLDLLLEQADRLRAELGVTVEFVNLGGGLGIPYEPTQPPFDLAGLGRAVTDRLASWEREHGVRRPRVLFESGRFVTGPHGALVTRVVNRMSKAREYVGVDAGMSALMRPAMYGAYHHITVPEGADRPIEVVDVVGSLCENNDKFAKQRALPAVTEGDFVVIHDTGAHALSMGFNYNGRLRPQELLLRLDGSVERVRRAEEERDYFATLDFEPLRLIPHDGSVSAS